MKFLTIIVMAAGLSYCSTDDSENYRSAAKPTIENNASQAEEGAALAPDMMLLTLRTKLLIPNSERTICDFNGRTAKIRAQFTIENLQGQRVARGGYTVAGRRNAWKIQRKKLRKTLPISNVPYRVRAKVEQYDTKLHRWLAIPLVSNILLTDGEKYSELNFQMYNPEAGPTERANCFK